MLTIQNLQKSYGSQPVLRGIDLNVEPGEIVALVGVNGAGKTTLASIVAGLLSADSGSVTVAGIDALKQRYETRRHFGLASQDVGLYPILTGTDNLTFFGKLAGMGGQDLRERIADLATSLELTEFMHKRVETLSGGQKRRLHTAVALLHRPGLLWLDEPTVGADIQSRQQLLGEVNRFASQGSSVIYATHYFPEVETLNASVAILAEGRIVARGDMHSIISSYASPSIELVFKGHAPANLVEYSHPDPEAGLTRILIPAKSPAQDLASIMTTLGESAIRLMAVELHQPTLESAFLSLTAAKSVEMSIAEEHLHALAS